MGVVSIQHRGHLHAPIPPVHLYVPPIPYIPHVSWDLGGICTLHMSWGLLGGINTSAKHFLSVSTSICLSVDNSHTSCSPSLWVSSLLDWMPMDVCYGSCCCSSLCSLFIMSQTSSTTAMTTFPLVSVVCSSTSSCL